MGRPSKPSKTLLASGRWQVRGTRAGKAFKKNYQSEAAADAALLALAGSAPLPLLPTRLSAPELRQAEAATELARALGLDLVSAVRWLAANYRPASSVTWADALKEYKQHRGHRATADRLENVEKSVLSFAAHVCRDTLGSPTRAEVESWLAKRLPSDCAPATFNHLLNDLSTFLGWHHKRGTLSNNAAAQVDRRKVRRGVPTTLPPAACEALLRDVERTKPEWVAWIALLLFAGLRPGLRDIGESARLNATLRAGKQVIFPGGVEIHGKTGKPRLVPWSACGPLRQWLEAYPLQNYLVPEEPARWEREWTKLRNKHNLGKDVLRHTAASMMIYSGRMSVSEVAFALDNSPEMLAVHYVGRWSREATEQVYALLPSKAPERVAVPATA